MPVELSLPSFNAVLHNTASSFSDRVACSINSLDKYTAVCYPPRAVFL